MTVIAVCVPTIPERNDTYLRCMDAYRQNTDGFELEWLVGYGTPTCGWGWQAASELLSARADYVHFTCDDIVPEPGWAGAAVKAMDGGWLPAPRVHNAATGAPEYFPQFGREYEHGTPAGFSCLPFVTRDLFDHHVKPLLTCHYFTDNWISVRAQLAGFIPRVVEGYDFLHHWCDIDRGAGYEYNERLDRDHKTFEQALGMWQSGQWTKPWPPVGDPRCRKAAP